MRDEVRLIRLISRTMVFSKTEPEKRSYEEWKKTVFRDLYKEGKKTPFDQEKFDEWIREQAKLFDIIPNEIFGKGVEWDRLLLGYVTKEQACDLALFCAEMLYFLLEKS